VAVLLDDDDFARARRHRAAGDPHAAGLAAHVAAIAARDPAEARAAEPDHHGQRVLAIDDHPTACACHHVLTGEAVFAERAVDTYLWMTGAWSGSDLRVGLWGLLGAQIADCAGAAVDGERRAALAARLVDVHRCLKEVRKGNPHQVGNNWWAITHSGALLAACAARDLGSREDDLEEGVDWAAGRVLAFCKHFGDAGLYHEGFGYQHYTCSHLFPALHALARRGDFDLDRDFPCLRRTATALLAPVVERAPFQDQEGGARHGWAAKLSWNDDGQGAGADGGLVLAIAWTPDPLRGALRARFDRLFGHAAPEPSWARGYQGLPLSLCAYPYDAPAAEPDAVLPKAICDSRQGLAIYRDRYRDRDDRVLGCYARSTHVGGHSHRDAGSVRFMAYDQDWIVGGGQARGRPEWQSVVVPAGGRDDGDANRATVLWDRADASGAVFGCDLRRVSCAYHERYVATLWPRGDREPCLLALLDQIDDHRGRAWDWHCSFAPNLAMEVHGDGRGYTLAAPEGQRACVRFLGPCTPESIRREAMPGSSRSYSSGSKVEYAGRPFVRARFAPREHLAIYAAMVVDPTREVLPSLADGLAIRIGEDTWARPFRAAIPGAFVPGASAGLSRHPTGDPGYRG